jgi:hypothetical protein
VTALEVARDAYPSPADSDAYRNGENVADVISVVQGAAEIGGGAGGAAGAIAGGVACVGLTAGGCVVVVAPGVPAAVAAGGASVVHGSAMLAKVAHGPQHAKTAAPESRYSFTEGHQKKAINRRWTDAELDKVFSNGRTVNFDASRNVATKKDFTMYLREDGHYVLRDVDGKIFQTSDTRKPDWVYDLKLGDPWANQVVGTVK